MKTRRTLAAAVVGTAAALLVLTQSPAFARPGHRDGHLAYRHIEHELQTLELDEATREAARGILEAAREEGRALHSRLKAAHGEMRTLLDQQSPDAEAVLAQADVIGALRTEMRKQQLRAVLQVQALLPSEAREAFLGQLEHRGSAHRRGCEDRSS